MAQIKFYSGLTESWKKLNPELGGSGYDDNAIYFLTDSAQLCKGGKIYSKSFEITSTTPTGVGKENVLYVSTSDKKLYTYNGASFVEEAFLGEDKAAQVVENDSKLVTGGAVYSFVMAQLEDIIAGSSDAYVTAITNKTDTPGVLVVKNGSGENNTEVSLTGVAITPSYDAETATLTIPVVGGDTVVAEFGKHLIIEDGTFNADTNEIVLTLANADKSEIKINVSSLVDTYLGKNTDASPIKVTVEDYNISANVEVSGAIEIKDGKLHVDLTDYLTTSDIAELVSTVTEIKNNYIDQKALDELAQSEAAERQTLSETLKAYADGVVNTALEWKTMN